MLTGIGYFGGRKQVHDTLCLSGCRVLAKEPVGRSVLLSGAAPLKSTAKANSGSDEPGEMRPLSDRQLEEPPRKPAGIMLNREGRTLLIPPEFASVFRRGISLAEALRPEYHQRTKGP